MAGSYNHCVDKEDGSGKLLVSEDLLSMLDCHHGDVYEAIEEMYGMIWLLASEFEASLAALRGSSVSAAQIVESARQRYQEGLAVSPGTGARLPQEEE